MVLLPPKSSNKIISKTVSKPPLQPSSSLLNAHIKDNNNNNNNNNKDKYNENVGPSERSLIKPSALRMPSPSYSFFSRDNASQLNNNNNNNNNSENSMEKTLKSISKPPLIPPAAARCRPPIGRIPTKPNNTPSTISKNQTTKKNIQQMQKSQKPFNNNNNNNKDGLIRVLDSKEETRVCEETKEVKIKNKDIIMLTEPNKEENQLNDLIKDEKFTNQIPNNLDLIENKKLKRRSSVYGLSPLKHKRDKIVISPTKLKTIDEKSKGEVDQDLNPEDKSSPLKNKRGKMVISPVKIIKPIDEKSKAEDMKSEAKSSIEEKKKAEFRKDLVPFSDEWLAALEAFGEDILEKKTGPVQHSPPDKTEPEPSPWSPVKRKVQDIGPYDCTKYYKAEAS